jgi:hypothetical protein
LDQQSQYQIPRKRGPGSAPRKRVEHAGICCNDLFLKRQTQLRGSSFSERRPNCARCNWRRRWRSRSFRDSLVTLGNSGIALGTLHSGPSGSWWGNLTSLGLDVPAWVPTAFTKNRDRSKPTWRASSLPS